LIDLEFVILSVVTMSALPEKLDPINSITKLDPSSSRKKSGDAGANKSKILLQVPGETESTGGIMSAVSPRSRPRLSFDESSIANTNRGGGGGGGQVQIVTEDEMGQKSSSSPPPPSTTPVIATISTGKLAPESILRRVSSPINSNSAPRPSLHSNTSDDLCSEIARLDQDPPLEVLNLDDKGPKLLRVVRIFQVRN
jgi:hypothetical protein